MIVIKMTKKELEDKYLTLLEQHLQLKSDLNSSEERLKLLSTKLQRVSNQHKSENSCSCKYSGKVTHTLQDVIARQKYKIEDLEMKNLSLLEKIRILKMNLSTQRQFLGTTGSMKRFHSVSGAGSLGTGRKYLSHRSVQSTNHLEKIASASSSTKSGFVEEQLENAVETKDASHVKSSKVSKGIQTNEDRQTEVNLTEELHKKIDHLEKELNNAEMNYNRRILSLEEEQKSLMTERDAALSSAHLSSQRQVEHTDCWNRVTAEQLREILAKNSELIMQLSMERKKVSDLELKLRECIYTTQLVDLVYDQLKHNKYICRVCKTLEEVVAINGLQATTYTDCNYQSVIETDNPNDEPNSAIEKLNATMNGKIEADSPQDMVPHNDKELITSEAPERDLGIEEKDYDYIKSRIPVPLPVTDEASDKGQQTASNITLPATSGHSEDDEDVVTGSRRKSVHTEDIVLRTLVPTNSALDNAQQETQLEQCNEDACETEIVKTKDKTSSTNSRTSQRTKSISQGTYTVAKADKNGVRKNHNGIKQNELQNIACDVSDETRDGFPSLREDGEYGAGQDSCSVDDTCSVSDSTSSAVTLSEGERPVFDDTSTSMEYSSDIQSSGWSQQFKSSNRYQNAYPDTKPDEACVLDRAKQVLSAVSEVLTECRELESKTLKLTADVSMTTRQ